MKYSDLHDDGKYPADHPIYSQPSWALVDALTSDGIYGLAPGQQVTKILEHPAGLGWVVVRADDRGQG